MRLDDQPLALTRALALARATVASLEAALGLDRPDGGGDALSRFVPIKTIVSPYSAETVWRDAVREGFSQTRGGRRYVDEVAYASFLASRSKVS